MHHQEPTGAFRALHHSVRIPRTHGSEIEKIHLHIGRNEPFNHPRQQRNGATPRDESQVIAAANPSRDARLHPMPGEIA